MTFDHTTLGYTTLRAAADLIDPDNVWEALRTQISLDVLDEHEAEPIIARLLNSGFQDRGGWQTRIYGGSRVTSREVASLNTTVTFTVAPQRRA